MHTPIVRRSSPRPRRSRFQIGVGLLALAVAAGGFGGCSDAPDPVLRLDVVRRLDQARVLVEGPFLDVGNSLWRGHLAAGWSTPEHGPGGDPNFTWTIDTTAFVDFVLPDPRFESLHFRAHSYSYDANVQQHVKISINGESLGRLELTPDFRHYEVEPGRGTLRTGLNRVTLEFQYAISPASRLGPGHDVRSLAVAFDWFEFTRADTPPVGMPAILPARRPQAAQSPDGRALLQSAGTALAYDLPPIQSASLSVDPPPRDPATPEPGIGIVSFVGPDGRPKDLMTCGQPSPAPRCESAPLRDLRHDLGTVLFWVPATSSTRTRLSWLRPRVLGAPLRFEDTTNVLWIVVDTLRPDVLSTYGGPIATPAIDALAERGVLFERAYSHIPITGPSHASMFTAKLPSEHGVLTNAQLLPEDALTLAEILAKTRQTAAFVSLGVLRRQFGFAQGFGEYHDAFDERWYATAGEMNGRILPWLRTRSAPPFFLFVHYSDPHEPYTPPGFPAPRAELRLRGRPTTTFPLDGSTQELSLDLERGEHVVKISPTPSNGAHRIRMVGPLVDAGAKLRFDSTWHRSPRHPSVLGADLPASFSIAQQEHETATVRLKFQSFERPRIPDAKIRYAAETRYVDAAIGDLLRELERLELADSTLVVFTSDHGEGLGDHGLLGHIRDLYDSLLRVPLIISWPGRVRAGMHTDGVARHVDLLPTILNLLGIPNPPRISGHSLTPLLAGRSPENSVVFAETHRPEAPQDKFAIVSRDQKYILTPATGTAELYDLRADPGELSNLVTARPSHAQLLAEQLAAHRQTAHGVAADATLDDQEIERLRALGYMR